MTKELNGAELAGFIKERQAKQVRALRQAYKIQPKLVILRSAAENSVIDIYIRYKVAYGDDILIETVVEQLDEVDMQERIRQLNNDDSVQGIIVQLPLQDTDKTNQIVATIAPEKDVDGMGEQAEFSSATAEAVNWLLTGYGVDLVAKTIVIIGRGRLVGVPLEKLWRDSGYIVKTVDEYTENTPEVLKTADVIVSAAGVPGLVRAKDIALGATVVDAGTTNEQGVIKGDVADDVRERDDITITPKIGGVGPLTIAMLYDHLIQACLKKAGFKS